MASPHAMPAIAAPGAVLLQQTQPSFQSTTIAQVEADLSRLNGIKITKAMLSSSEAPAHNVHYSIIDNRLYAKVTCPYKFSRHVSAFSKLTWAKGVGLGCGSSRVRGSVPAVASAEGGDT
jgi:hypothetical protein